MTTRRNNDWRSSVVGGTETHLSVLALAQELEIEAVPLLLLAISLRRHLEHFLILKQSWRFSGWNIVLDICLQLGQTGAFTLIRG